MSIKLAAFYNIKGIHLRQMTVDQSCLLKNCVNSCDQLNIKINK